MRLEKLWKMKFQGIPTNEESVPRKRKRFSKSTKQIALLAQRNLCANCGTWLDVADFDHTNGDRSDNHWTNCRALCPNCHAKKTRRKRL